MTKSTAEERAGQLMMSPINQAPDLAIQYIKFLSKLYGYCSEVAMTAFAHYAQAVEHLSCKDASYKIDKQGKDFFKSHPHKPESVV